MRNRGIAVTARESPSTRWMTGRVDRVVPTNWTTIANTISMRARGNPAVLHDHTREIAVVGGEADATDGLEISSRPLGPGLPHGVMVAMNSTPQNFLVFRWQDVAAALKPNLKLNTAR